MAENMNQFPNRNRVTEEPTISMMAFRLAKTSMRLVLKFNFTLLLIAYNTSVNLAGRMLTPFEPIAVEVRKVPKKDISVEGIFYQFLRLQFLVLLYLWPLAVSAAKVMARPLVRLKEWMIEYIHDGEEEEAWRRTDPSVLKEG